MRLRTVLQIGIAAFILLLCSCKQSSDNTENTQESNSATYERTTTWTDKDMEFQVSYCLEIMSAVEDLEQPQYCECFLNKAKYYYKTVEILHAYRQEQDFSRACMDLHYTGE